MQLFERLVAEHRVTGAKANLIEAHARSYQHRKGAGANFSIKRSGVALHNAVKFFAMIGDRAGQKIQSAGRRFRIGDSLYVRREVEPLHQRYKINAALFQDRTLGQVNSMHLKFTQPLCDRCSVSSEKGCAHPVGGGS